MIPYAGGGFRSFRTLGRGVRIFRTLGEGLEASIR